MTTTDNSPTVFLARCCATGPHTVQVALNITCPSVDAATFAGHLVAELTRRNAEIVSIACVAAREATSEESPHEP